MPVKRTIPHNSGMFFITFTCHKWLSLIDTINGYDIIYKWFDHLKSKGHFINGYVIMPNHVHALISFINTTQSINTIIGNGKRFMAYEIISRFEKNNETALLVCALPNPYLNSHFWLSPLPNARGKTNKSSINAPAHRSVQN